MAFDKTDALCVQGDVERLLKEYFAKHNLAVKVDHMRWASTTVGMTVNVFEKPNGQGEITCQNWDRYAVSSGLKKEWLGAKVTMNDKMYQVVGFDPGRSKKSIQLRRVGDPLKVYICPPNVLQRHASELDASVRNRSVDQTIERLPEALKAVEKAAPTSATRAFAPPPRQFGDEW